MKRGDEQRDAEEGGGCDGSALLEDVGEDLEEEAEDKGLADLDDDGAMRREACAEVRSEQLPHEQRQHHLAAQAQPQRRVREAGVDARQPG